MIESHIKSWSEWKYSIFILHLETLTQMRGVLRSGDGALGQMESNQHQISGLAGLSSGYLRYLSSDMEVKHFCPPLRILGSKCVLSSVRGLKQHFVCSHVRCVLSQSHECQKKHSENKQNTLGPDLIIITVKICKTFEFKKGLG